jgi:predicted O-linked N-acetylglucosamine transferase (SPINDLY family)
MAVLMRQAAALYGGGAWADAERSCSAILATRPDHFGALSLLGIIAAQSGRLLQAAELLERAATANPGDARAHNNYGNVLRELARNAEALESYQSALKLKPDYAEAWNNRGNALRDLGRLAEALASYERALALKPSYAEAHNNRGVTLEGLKRFEDAMESFASALRLRPDYAEAHYNRGNVLRALERPEEALESYERALIAKGDFAEAHYNRGNVLRDLERPAEALASYEQGLKFRPDFADGHCARGDVLRRLKRHEEALQSFAAALALSPQGAEIHKGRGRTLHDLGRFDEALQSYQRALAINPRCVEAHDCHGLALHDLRRHAQALESYQHALAIDPDDVQAWNNRGLALSELERYDEALASYERALTLKADFAEAWNNRGLTLRAQGRLQEAVECFGRALAVSPEFEWVFGLHLHGRMQLCEWEALDSRISDLTAKIADRKPATTPFPVFALVDSPSLQQQAAQIWMSDTCAPVEALPPLGRRPRDRKIRLGYYSADFHAHATAYLIAGLIEQHDRSSFEVLAFSFGPERGDDMRKRLTSAFDQFIDVRDKSDNDIAALSRELGIDIAVDLKGYTQHERSGIFARRAAAIQVSYLGYPGTMGVPYIDYLVADATLIPSERRPYYTEKIVYLPHSYQVNDRKREIADRAFSRDELGLPPRGFVFCCFNNSYKITPEVFDMWMRLLRQVDGSVLWLLEDTVTAAENLRREAAARGVAPRRLVFAPRMPQREHLARHRAADLFLDTCPYNAHTTASDALWSGLPVLTRLGESFAARVAGSLLNAIGLPELITGTAEAYEARALELATEPARLAALKERLERNRMTQPLFDTPLYTRHLEQAYRQMYERCQAGLGPDHLYVTTPDPEHTALPPSAIQQAAAAYAAGEWARSEELCRALLAAQPGEFDALNLLGIIAGRTGRAGEAAQLLRRAVAARPDAAAAHINYGNALTDLGCLEEALQSYGRALTINPRYAEAHFNRANILKRLGHHAEALRSYECAVQAKPDYFEAYNNRANVLKDLRRFDEALENYERALKIRSDDAELYYNRGNALRECGRLDEALASYDRALSIRSDYAEACCNRGHTLSELQRLDEARDSYVRALSIAPELPWLYGSWLHGQMRLCEWNETRSAIAALPGKLIESKQATTPFTVATLVDSPSSQLQAARNWVSETSTAPDGLPPLARRPRGRKIRLGYYSADFHGHATAHLIAGLIEHHDRKQFEAVAFSFGPQSGDDMRKRVTSAFDRFIDVRSKTDREVAELSREHGIDIAVDLKGYTQNARTGIFSYRAAPVQVSYLGYPGTMGASCIDYLIADAMLIPPDSRPYYTEKIVYLPHSYQVNDRKRPIADRHYSREELGLPPKGFVFCCFNNSYKITPEVFDIWMGLLRQVEGSALWLLEDNAPAAQNLSREAHSRGVDAQRLVFAPRLPIAEHLARHRAADLFLDTLPCNAHTTASDALWAGLPVLTQMGESFAARVAGSLLNAIGLQELITGTAEQYEARALELATEPARLALLKERLERNRSTRPLFDTPLYTRHLEDAYRQMYDRHQAGLSPECLHVVP